MPTVAEKEDGWKVPVSNLVYSKENKGMVKKNRFGAYVEHLIIHLD